MKTSTWLIALSFIALLLPCSSHALRPDVSLAQYVHSSWTVKDGVPGEVNALAQTRDGYLLVGAMDGLARFDGVTLEMIPSVSGVSLKYATVKGLLVKRDGDLIVGTVGDGAILSGKGFNGQVGFQQRQYWVLDASEAPDGAIYALCNKQLCQVTGDRVQVGASGYPTGDTISYTIDRYGTVWALSEAGGGTLYSRPSGAPAFARFGDRFEATRIVAVEDRLLICGPHGIQVLSNDHGRPGQGSFLLTREASDGPVMMDRDDNLWMSSSKGIRVVRDGRKRLVDAMAKSVEERFDLQVAGVNTIFEDRDGNVWVGTSAGLERFRNAVIVNAPLPAQLKTVYKLVVAVGGGVWGLNEDGAVVRVDRNALTVDVDDKSKPGKIYTGPDGTIWFAGERGLATWRSGKPERVVSHLDFSASLAMVMDAQGAFWIDMGGHEPPIKLVDGVPTPVKNPGLHPADWNFRSALADSRGRLWFATTAAVVVIDRGVTRVTVNGSDGFSVGHATGFFERNGHVWIGGTDGLAAYDGQHFHTLMYDKRESFTGIAESPNGDLWLNSIHETLLVPAKDVDEALKTWQPFRHVRHLGTLDGRTGLTEYDSLNSTVLLDDKGVPWITTSTGVAWLDVHEINRTKSQPTPIVLSLRADGKVRADNGGRLPSLTQQVQVDYTAPELSLPERMRFRYRIDGVDADWQDVGTRRAAYYNNLGPGTYRFRVTSTNEDGLWNPKEATLDFSIAPAWFQTLWFRALCLAIVLVLLYALHALRLRQLALRMAERQHTQLRERERIARELHDTLLQSVSGLTMLFHSVAQSLPEKSPQRHRAEIALERAAETLEEGRERVHDLRGATGSPGTLDDILKRICEDLLPTEGEPNVAFTSTGAQRPLREIVRDELAQVLAEGLRNAFKHAHASKVDVHLDYGNRWFQATLRDNGQGMEPATLAAGRSMHWGLRGMRERAMQLGGSCEIVSEPGNGTTIRVRVLAVRAYGRMMPWWRRLQSMYARRRARTGAA
jgi:signal transduction histidine kinase/ligand-binding sensor domain-containing protein